MMPDLTKPPTKEQIEAWPPLTRQDIYEVEKRRSEMLKELLDGSVGQSQLIATTQAHEISALWPRIVTTAMLLWQLQKEANLTNRRMDHE